MAQWEDDLRAVVEHRGAALVEHARELLPGADPTDDGRAVTLTVDALVAAFRRGGRRAAGEHGSVRLVDDDDLGVLEAGVRREQDRLAPAGGAPAPAAPVPPPDDGPSDALSARLPEVVTRVQAARRRGRRRALVGSAAVVVAALATTAFAARPWDRATQEPAPTDTPYAGACGAPLPAGKSLLRVSYNKDASDGSSIVAGQTWHAEFDASSTPDPTSLAVAETLTPEIVVTRGGKVVALGVSTPDDTFQDEDGNAPSAPSFTDMTDGGPAFFSVRFVACDGGDLAAGSYQARLFATTDDGSAHVLSAAADLTVLSAAADGYQPAWLEGSALACGEQADDFVTRASALAYDGLDQIGSATYDDGDAVILRNGGRAARKVELPRGAVAWVQDGRIVGVGPDERASRATTVRAGKQVEVSARPWDATDYCTPTTGGKPGHLPAGTYQAVLYGRVPAGEPGAPDRWILDDERGNDLVVGLDGSVSYGGAAASAGAALTQKGFQPSWVRGSALQCGMTDDAFTTTSAAHAAAEIGGSFSLDNDGRLGSELTVRGSGKQSLTTPSRIGVAWFTTTRGDMPGRLVSFGSDLGPGRRATVDGTTSRDTTLDTVDTCAPGADGTFALKLPAGSYWVAFYTWVRRPGGQPQWLTDGGAMGVTVEDDGTVTGR
ncbi:hypothetical protein [Luteimicrobium sp. DT211]|uniref:hypothetical protein n=1 Tax=Luteimicrobium sp. DT211 TaxID=3393412 RepID=UPI003CEEC367